MLELVDELVGREVPGSTGKARSELLRYCGRLLSTRLRRDQEQIEPNSRPGTDGRLADELCGLVRRIKSVRQSAEIRSQCDELIMLLTRKNVLSRPGAAVRMLCQLSDTAQASKRVIDLPSIADTERLAGGSSSIVQSVSEQLVAAAAPPKPQARQAPAVDHKRLETEAILVRDVLYCFQGIDGHLVRYSSESNAYIVSPVKTISPGMRSLVEKLCELGWLYKRVACYVQETINDSSLGLVVQSFASALQDELTEYFRLIAVLEGQLAPSEGDPLPRQGGAVEGTERLQLSLTLRQLAVWSREPLRRMQLLAEMADSVKGLIGGSLASVVHIYSMHGDAFVASFIEDILKRVSSPIFESIRLWILHGELDDHCSEFFVSACPGVPDERLWFDKYKLRSSMIPSYISRSLAKKILLVGKSINFVRFCCNGGNESDVEKHDTTSENIELDFAMLNSSETDSQREAVERDGIGYSAVSSTDRTTVRLLRAIDRAAASTNSQLRQILFDRFHLVRHCRALKQYLMLGQGDTIQHLLDLLSPQLSLPASQVHRHSLVTQLDTAVRASNAHLDSGDVLERLDVRLLQASPGDSGWDVFVLDYHLDSPLNCVITADAMAKYYEIFTFLWRLKRVEYGLSSAWKQEKTTGRNARELKTVGKTLHKFNTLRNEMIHFTSNLHSYIMFEVLETSWEMLVVDFEAAADLDQIVAAHERYLARIMEKSLIGTPQHSEPDTGVSPTPSSPAFGDNKPSEPDANSLRQSIQNLFDLILRFCSLQKRLYTRVVELITRIQQTRINIMQRTESSKWGIDTTDPSAMVAAEQADAFADPALVHGAQVQIAEEFERQAILISSEYRTSIRSFLESLEPASSENLKFLRFRLDFNLFYSGS